MVGETEVEEYRSRLVSRLPDWVDRFDSLAVYLTYGPRYERGVADNWRTAVRMAGEGRTEEAEYWFQRAVQAA